MKTQHLILFFCLLFTPVTYAQNLVWAHQNGGLADDKGNAVAVDGAGNVYTTGQFRVWVDFDPGPGTSNLVAVQEDIYIQKLDAAGNFVWVKQMSGINAEYGVGLAADNSGNLIVTGVFQGTVDFDPGPGTAYLTATGAEDYFILKLNPSGNLTWLRHLSSPYPFTIMAMTMDNAGRSYFAGSFEDSLDADPGPGATQLASQGLYDAFIIKLDAAGDLIWAKQFGGPDIESADALAVDNNGNVLLCGYFSDTVDFDPGPGVYEVGMMGGSDIFLQKLDAAGNFIWARTIGDASADYGRCVDTDPGGNIYFAGTFEGTTDLDPGPGTLPVSVSGQSDYFIEKLDPAGNLIWVNAFGSNSGQNINSLVVDTNGNCYATGNFQGTLDLDPGPGNFSLQAFGSDDIYVQKLNAAGHFVHAFHMGGMNTDYPTAIAYDPTGHVLLTGYINDTADFDPGAGQYPLISSGAQDIFVARFTAGCGQVYSSIQEEACNSYLSPSGMYNWTSSGTYTDTLPGFCGDSIITIDLNIIALPNTVSQQWSTLTADASNASYQWLDCNQNYAPLPGETAQQFTAVTDGLYAVRVSNGTCTDTSACIPMVNVALDETSGSWRSIWPNPCSDILHIRTSSVVAQGSIYDLQGRLRDAFFPAADDWSVPVHHLPAGMYLLELITETGSVYAPLMIVH